MVSEGNTSAARAKSCSNLTACEREGRERAGVEAHAVPRYGGNHVNAPRVARPTTAWAYPRGSSRTRRFSAHPKSGRRTAGPGRCSAGTGGAARAKGGASIPGRAAGARRRARLIACEEAERDADAGEPGAGQLGPQQADDALLLGKTKTDKHQSGRAARSVRRIRSSSAGSSSNPNGGQYEPTSRRRG